MIEKLTGLIVFVAPALFVMGCDAHCSNGTRLVGDRCVPLASTDTTEPPEDIEPPEAPERAEKPAAAPVAGSRAPGTASQSNASPVSKADSPAAAPATPSMRMDPADAGTVDPQDASAPSSNVDAPAAPAAAMKPPACTKEASVRCSTAMPGQRERCQAGAWTSSDACAAGEICVDSDDDALCVTPDEACMGRAGQNICNADGALLMCDAHGSSTLIEACTDPKLCSAGLEHGACAKCVPGSHKCSGSQLQACNADGEAFALQEPCASEELCDEARGRCAPALCKPDEYACDGDSLKHCNRALNGFDLKKQCGAGLCDEANKTCRICMPGQHKCSGNTRQECDASGQSFVAAACPSETPLCTGAGSCIACRLSSDCAPHACQVSGCSLGACSYTPEPKGTPACNIPDGSTIQVKGADEIYVVVGGAKFWIHTPDEVNNYFGGFGKTMALDSAVVQSCNAVPAAGTNVRQVNEDAIYRIGTDGQAHHILRLEDLLNSCGGGDSVRTIPQGGLAGNGISSGSDI